MAFQTYIVRKSSSKIKSIFHNFRRMSSTVSEDPVLCKRIGNKGVFTLNRPKALNSLNLQMVRMMQPKILEWHKDPSIEMVLIKGVGEKAFCAGGDVVAMTKSYLSGGTLMDEFFKEEYALNNAIGTLGVPYVALIDGITMGGGVGLSVHGTFRVATERTLFAMPETAIGLFPDVGGSYFLPKLPGKLGIYLALTGFRLKGRHVQKAGIATHFVASEKIDDLEKSVMALQNPTKENINEVLDSYQKECTLDSNTDFILMPHIDRINNIFGHESLEKIFDALEKDNSDWSKKHLDILKKMSPTSMKITLHQLQEGAKMSLQDCLTMEYRMSQGCKEGHDFHEGVRAVLIDKDNSPKWKPATIADVTKDDVLSYFKPLPDGRDLLCSKL